MLFQECPSWKALFYSRSSHLYIFSIRKKSQNLIALTHRFLRESSSKVIKFILQGVKRNSLATETVTIHYACICKQTLPHILTRLYALKLFTTALQITKKACNHERNYQLKFLNRKSMHRWTYLPNSNAKLKIFSVLVLELQGAPK